MSKYYDKTAASFKSVTIDTKVLDAQKILINSNPNDINLRENLLDVLNGIDVTPSYISYQYIDYCDKSSNTGECSAVKLHANLLPHDKNIKAIRFDVANTVNTETWLVAYLVDANNNFTSIGKSINSNTWSAGDLVEWEFDKAFLIPEGSYLQLYIADANSTISSNNVTRPSYKIALYVANHSGDNQDSVRYDGTWYNQRRVYVQFKEELTLELSQYLDYKLDQVQGLVNTNTDSINSIGQDVETNSENIESLRQDVNSLLTYQDAVRDVNTMQGTLDNATIYGILYSKEHFGISGTQISKVTLPYNVQSGQSNTGYLVAQVFDNANQLVASYYSEGTHTFSNAGPAIFNFKDAYIAVNYKFIRFVLVANKTVALPTSYNSINSNCLSFRARPIKWSDSFTFDDDDCLSYSNQSTGTLNWLIGMTIDYKLRVENDIDNGEIRITAPHSLGDFYFSITSHMPEGVLPLNGSEVSRVTYSDLYDYVLNIHNELVTSDKKFIVSDEEWLNISIENNGYVPYYSYGTTDGMFRLPRMSGYLKATGEVDEAGNYVAEGLPNITGGYSNSNRQESYSSTPEDVNYYGAFEKNEYVDYTAQTATGKYNGYGFTFDASRSNSIYGNSEHVTPETNTLFVGVWALTAFTQVGTANLSEIKEILSQCETVLGDSLPLLSSRYDNKGLETSAWKIGDGSWLDGRIYTEAYDKLIEKVAEGNSQYLLMKESELLSPIEFPESYLVDTENVKFRLPLMVVNERTIIKEWQDGLQWYRIWSDGYLEQGGEAYNSKAGDFIVSLNYPFKNTEFTVTKTPGVDGSYAGTGIYVQTWNYTPTSFTTATSTQNGLTRFRWYAFGYTEIPPREEWEIDFSYYFKVSHGVDEGKINIEEKLTLFEETAYTRLNEVVEEVSKDYVVHVDKQVGELYFSFNDYFPDGVIPLDGRLVSRATYADLWQWVQEKGLVKDDTLITTNDENTVSIFNEDGTIRYCQWYGSGDGELTFRMPKINGYLGATGDNSLAGQYIAEGLPNITGEFKSNYTLARDDGSDSIGSIISPYNTASGRYGNTSSDGAFGYGFTFDASLSNPIYGNSENVTPETNTLFVGVWAITATKAAVFDMRDVEEALKSAESYLMNNVPLMSSRWDRDGLGNLGWVKADGSWVDGRTYTGAYDYCVEKLVSGHTDFVDGNLAIITQDNCSKFIVDRINKRFRLPINNGQRQLVAAYKEGTQWYNIYSDGWIEQGGEVYNDTTAVITVDLLVPFKDSSYTVDKIIGVDGAYSSGVGGEYLSTHNYTTTSFTTRTYGGTGLNRFRWFAKGYGEVLSIASPLRTSHLYFKLAHEFYAPTQEELQEKLDLIDNLVVKTDINLPTLSSRWDSDFAENIGWVKSEGQWINGNIYRDAYDMMVSRIGINDKFIAATVGTELTNENADKFLIDTAAVKFRLPLINGERVLIKSSKINTEWFDYYSDGWVEQGGEVPAKTEEIIYHVSFNDINYYINRTSYGLNTSASGSSAYSGVGKGKTETRTISSVTFESGANCLGHIWQAKGYARILNPTEYNRGLYLFFKLADEVQSTAVNTQQLVDDISQEVEEVKSQVSLKKGYVDYLSPEYLAGTETTAAEGNKTVIAPFDCMASIGIGCPTSSTNTHCVGYVYIDEVRVGALCAFVAKVGNNIDATTSMCLPVKLGQTIKVLVGTGGYTKIIAFPWN